ADDKALLEGLIGKPLFDPKGAQRVRVPVVVRSVWARGAIAMKRDGWLLKRDGEPPRIYFTDGDSMAAPPEKETEVVDFIAFCEARDKKNEQPSDDDEFDARFAGM